ncbi:MAG: FHA domain-containing protein [Fimbriimonadaceae bacterium]|nr:FHA domain-containing protein [Fimbriimonadaceae bacterium]
MSTPHDMSEEMIQDAPPVIDESEEAEVSEEAVIEEASETTGPRLIVKRAGAETDISFSFSCPAIIGRFDPSVGPIDIDLGNLDEGVYVSRKHAKITEADGVYSISDLGSSNGTYVLQNDEFKKVDETEINDGDEIALGNARFVFRLS